MGRRLREEASTLKTVAFEQAQAAALRVAEAERAREENVRLEKIRVANEAKKNAELAEWTKAQARAFKADLRQQVEQNKAEQLWLEAGTHVRVDYLGHSFVVPKRRMPESEVY